MRDLHERIGIVTIDREVIRLAVAEGILPPDSERITALGRVGISGLAPCKRRAPPAPPANLARSRTGGENQQINRLAGEEPLRQIVPSVTERRPPRASLLIDVQVQVRHRVAAHHYGDVGGSIERPWMREGAVSPLGEQRDEILVLSHGRMSMIASHPQAHLFPPSIALRVGADLCDGVIHDPHRIADDLRIMTLGVGCLVDSGQSDESESRSLRAQAQRTRFAFIALTGIDKTSHAEGHDAQIVSDAMRIVDDTVAQIRSDAERDGRWKKMSLWVGSDHGHSPVREHEDLVALLSEWGYSTLSHPWAFNTSADIAVMVSGNAMAHLYLDIDQKTRPWWPALGDRWNDLSERLLSRQSVDLLILPTGPASCEIRGRGRGSATLAWSESRYSYAPKSCDPLGIGGQNSLGDGEAYDLTIDCDYPDALVQIAHLVACPRSGDIILSAARDWDYRARYEPIPHVSSHGALHREHMLVPLLLNRAPTGIPRRTVDVMPSALAALGITAPKTLDGVSFF